MGSSSSSPGSQPNSVVMKAAEEAFTKALIQEMDRPQQDDRERELLDRISKLEAAQARRQELEDEKKNEKTSPTKSSENSQVATSFLTDRVPEQTVIPGRQETHLHYGKPLIQSSPTSGNVGHEIGQSVMGHEGGQMVGSHQGGLGQTMAGTQPGGQIMSQPIMRGPGGLNQPMMQGGPMIVSQQSGQLGQSMAGTQPGGQIIQPNMRGPGGLNQPMMQGGPMTGPQQPGRFGQSMTGTQPGGQMSHSMMGPIGQPMMGTHQGAQMNRSVGPQQFSLHPSGPMGPLPGFCPQPDATTGYGPLQGPMADFNPQFQPPIGRMGPQMPHNRGAVPHPYRRGPQHNNIQNNSAQHNQRGPTPNQNQYGRRNQPREQPRARSSSREKNAPPKRTNNPYRQNNKADAVNQKPNQGAIPKQKTPQPNSAAQKTKKQPQSDSGSEKSLPNKNNDKKKNSKQGQKSDSSSEKPQEKGVPKTKKEKNPLFSNKASKTSQRVDEYLNSMKTQKPEGAEEKVVLNFDDLAKLNTKNPELWDLSTLAKLFGKDDVATKQSNPTSSGTRKPFEINDLVQMFEPDEDRKPVDEPKTSKRPYLGTPNYQKKNPAVEKFNTNDLRCMLENMKLLTTKESKTPIDLKELIEKIKLPSNTEQKNTVPKPPRAGTNQSTKSDGGPKKSNAEGSEPPAQKRSNQPLQRGFKKKQIQHKKVMQTSDDSSDSSDDSSDSDSDFSSVSRDSFKTAVGAKQPLADQAGKQPFLKHLTPGELPPLSKMYTGKKSYLNFFIGKKIPSKKEARAMGVKTAQLYRKVQGVVIFDRSTKTFDFPSTIMDIVEFGEKHPDAVATYTADM